MWTHVSKTFFDAFMSSNYLPSTTRATYAFVHLFAKLCLKNVEKFSLLKRLCVKVGNERNLDISRVNSLVLYCLKPDKVKLMIEAADNFMKNLSKSTTAKSAPSEKCKGHTGHAAST